MKERGGGAALLMARSGEEAVEVSGAGLHARGEETVRMSGARMEERGGVGGTSWRHGFDLDLMDLQMPGMDGFAAADAIRAHERKQVLEMAFKARQAPAAAAADWQAPAAAADWPAPPRVPIVALTADVDCGVVQRFAEGGFDGVLQKWTPTCWRLTSAKRSSSIPCCGWWIVTRASDWILRGCWLRVP
ncbi:hypothetical protein CLOM_g13377 [Closterium sp. NIES-68]|nr:hypothetical protein CLOM_g13377 [Closterium sp. NIES-68]